MNISNKWRQFWNTIPKIGDNFGIDSEFRFNITRCLSFGNNDWIRVGTYKKPLSDHPERERKIWNNNTFNCFEKKIAKSGISVDEVLLR